MLRIDTSKIANLEFWFNIDIARLHLADKIVLGGGVVFVIIGLIFRLTARFAPNPVNGEVFRRLSNLALTIGILEIVWFGFRWENVLWLGTRIVAAAILGAGLVWLFHILKYLAKRYAKDLATWQKQQVKQKYLDK